MARRQDEDYEYTLVPIIETNMSHNDSGFCDDLTCPCHEDPGNIYSLNEHVQNGLASNADADRLYRGLKGRG